MIAHSCSVDGADLARLERTPTPLRDGRGQYRVRDEGGDPATALHVYASAEELRAVASHLAGLAYDLELEAAANRARL